LTKPGIISHNFRGISEESGNEKIVDSVLGMAVIALGASLSRASSYSFLTIPFYAQDFDALANGTINGQDGWFGTASDVVQSGVAVSGKALQVDSGAGRSSASSPLTFSTTHNLQKVSFDIEMTSVITDFAGTPNQDIQETIQFRGPKPNQQFFLVYKAQLTTPATS
jgi:hypothetical protein